jgi:hypothetical protein
LWTQALAMCQVHFFSESGSQLFLVINAASRFILRVVGLGRLAS